MQTLFEQFVTANADTLHLAVALLLGTLIGVQRGWQARDRNAGGNFLACWRLGKYSKLLQYHAELAVKKSKVCVKHGRI